VAEATLAAPVVELTILKETLGMLISEIIKVPLYPAGVTPDIVTLDPLAKPVRLVIKYVANPTPGKLGVILMSVAVETAGVITPAVVKVALEYPETPTIDKEIVPE
jgi:hypothetical protein